MKRLIIFSKAQMSAFTGGVADYLIMVFLTEYIHLYYVLSIIVGGIAGAVINFHVNKRWTFHSKNEIYKNTHRKQFLKFLFVVVNSIALKSSGTYLITSYLDVDYKLSRIMIDLVVSVIVNYPLQKHWVFKKVVPLSDQ